MIPQSEGLMEYLEGKALRMDHRPQSREMEKL
jgi:hypothetical protein